MLGFIGLLMAGAASVLGFAWSRKFVRRRLTYIDSVQSGSAPIIAGLGAALLALPIVWVLPLVGTGTAILFGGAVGLGVASGAKEIRRRLHAG